MDLFFKCIIPGRPIVKKNTQKFFKGGGRRLSKQYVAWEHTAMLYVKEAANMWFAKRFRPHVGRIRMQAIFYFENRQAEADLSNLYEGIQDILTKCEVIQDDKWIYSHDGSTKVFGEEPRLEVMLYSL